MIIDAGGGTVDLSTYKITQVGPIAVKEIAPSDCEFLCRILCFRDSSSGVALRYLSRICNGTSRSNRLPQKYILPIVLASWTINLHLP